MITGRIQFSPPDRFTVVPSDDQERVCHKCESWVKGECLSEKIGGYGGSDGISGTNIEVGPFFGCIHWRSKNG